MRGGQRAQHEEGQETTRYADGEETHGNGSPGIETPCARKRERAH